MSIESVAALAGAPLTTATPTIAPTATGPTTATTATAATAATPSTQGSDFGAWLDKELAALNSQVGAAEQSLTQLATGDTGNLHRVMLDLEQTRTSFQLAVQVRNKLLESYQDLMRMQI